MAELVAISQSSLLLPQFRFRGPRSFICCRGFRASSVVDTSICCLRSRSGLGVLSRTICAQRQQKPLSKGIARVVSDSKAPTLIVESAGEDIEIQPDTSGGDGFGGEAGSKGGGGGGGRGGGNNNNNNEGEGGSDESNNYGSGDSEKRAMSMSMSQKLTLGYAALVGVGGVMGYLKSGSQKSLMAGGLSALLLYYVYTELPKRPAFASSLGLGLSAALLGVMGSRFRKSGKMFPAGVVSLVSIVMTSGYLHGILHSLH